MLRTAGSLFLLALCGAADARAESLAPGAVRERSLEVGEAHVWDLSLEAGTRFRIRVDQHGLDVALSVAWPGSEGPWRLDSPIDRDGPELVLLPASVAGPVRLEVRGLVSAGGSYRVRFDPVDDPALLAPLAAMTEAGRAYAEGTGDGRRRAAERYRDAAGQWQRLRRPRLAAQGLYSAAVLHRLLGEREAALDLDREVLPLWRELGEAGREADTLNEIGLLEADGGDFESARRSFEGALAVQERAGDRFRQAASASNVCLTYLRQGDLEGGVDCYVSALERIRSAGDGETEATALMTVAHAYKLMARPDDALAAYERALALHRAAGRDKRVAETLNNLGVLYRTLGEHETSLALYLEALEVFRRVGDRRWEVKTLHNLAVAYDFLGDPDRAQVFGRRALELRQELGDRTGEALELRRLGHLESVLGRPVEALELYRRALALEEETGDRRRKALTQSFLAEGHAGTGEPSRALEIAEQALAEAEPTGDRSLRADLLLGSGRYLIELGRPEEAAPRLDEALQLYRALRDERSAAWTLYRTAAAAAARGEAGEALERLDEALRGFESLQAEVRDAELRASFSGSQRDAYELRIELLMRRDQERPEDPGPLRAALETSERARAWSLVELLQQAGAEPAVLADPKLDDQLRSARRRFRLAAERLRQAGDSTVKLESLFLESLAELEGLEARLRRDEPAASELVRPRTLAADEVRALLDPGTVLLEYALGKRRGWLFLVRPAGVRAFELPAREVLDDLARRAYRELSAPGGGGAAAAELSRLALAPALAEIAGKDVERLLVVPDGALSYLPFAALPTSAGNGVAGGDGVLIESWEVVHLPSASALALERRRAAGRPPASSGVAVLADPVFDEGDLRLARSREARSHEAPSGEAPETAARGGPDLPRLRLSRQEAESVLALAPPGESFAALDFEATRDLVLSGRLAGYRVVHFATHSLVDSRHPALSGLALSHFDHEGRPLDGFLGLRDVYSLELSADLVVLSACRTALGKEVRGEGLVGLVSGFLHAGARRVVASLWSVSDRSTAELMSRFYRGLLVEKLPPATALRRAQLSLRGESRFRDPHHWAGFVLIGDWR